MSEVFLIVGGGQAGGWAAKTLRQEGFKGSVVVVSEEDQPPYERPPLSKQVLLGEAPPESTQLFPAKVYADLGIELRLSTRVTALAPQAHLVGLADGTQLRYDRLLLATGAAPRKLPGRDSRKVFYLRSIPDAIALRSALGPEARALVIGGGWIGLEVAAAARKLGAEVTLIEAGARLCARAAPKEVSAFLLSLHRSHGIDVRLATTIASMDGRQTRLSTGEALDPTCIVAGIGVAPSTSLAAAAGLQVDNGIVVDSQLRTSAPDIFAAGDVANRTREDGATRRLESWDNAQKHGIAAARAMLDKPVAHERFPWFWSDQHGANVQLLGQFAEDQEALPVASNGGAARVILYRRRGVVEGAVGINAGREIRLLKRSLESGQPVLP
jgi:3-phenylpropionate/trans-cinnamate dioxygenase ferredoxin reductase component